LIKNIIALGLLSVSFSQFERVDERLASCEKNCCGLANASWNGSCINTGQEYSACKNMCLEEAQRSIKAISPGSDMCCAPGIVVLGLGFWVLGLGFWVLNMRKK